jgi:hypothetical protein
MCAYDFLMYISVLSEEKDNPETMSREDQILMGYRNEIASNDELRKLQ